MAIVGISYYANVRGDREFGGVRADEAVSDQSDRGTQSKERGPESR